MDGSGARAEFRARRRRSVGRSLYYSTGYSENGEMGGERGKNVSRVVLNGYNRYVSYRLIGTEFRDCNLISNVRRRV